MQVGNPHEPRYARVFRATRLALVAACTLAATAGCSRTAQWDEVVPLDTPTSTVTVQRTITYHRTLDQYYNPSWAPGPERIRFKAPPELAGITWTSPSRLRFANYLYFYEGRIAILSSGNECRYEGAARPMWLAEAWTGTTWERIPIGSLPSTATRTLTPVSSENMDIKKIELGDERDYIFKRAGGDSRVLELTRDLCPK